MGKKRNQKRWQKLVKFQFALMLLAVIFFTGYSTAIADEGGVTVASFNYTTGEYSQFKSQYNVVSSFNKYYNNDLIIMMVQVI